MKLLGYKYKKKQKKWELNLLLLWKSLDKKYSTFEYGDDFGEKIKEVNADFVKILVRWNPDDDADTRQIQGERIKKII